MDYQQTLENLYQRSFCKKKWDLTAILDVQKKLNYPDRSYLSIHIGGTNGKGSVAYKLASILTAGGYRTGLFTSPHIASFQERIRIDGKMICKSDVVTYSSLLLKEKNVSFFEVITLMAMLYFKDQKVQAAVFETGMGGRLDATNILHPIVSVITSISIDHTAYLGKTLDEISSEKAGIIKEKTPLVLGPKAQREPLLQKAKEKKSSIHLVKGEFSFFDEENQAVSAMAMQEIKKHFSIPLEVEKKQIKKRPKCRFEVLSKKYLQKYFSTAPEAIVLDVAHNEDAFKKLKTALHEKYPGKKMYVVLGLSKNKEIDRCIKEVITFADGIFCVQAHSLRALEKESLYKEIQKHSFFQAHNEDTMEESLLAAMKKGSREDAVVVVTGSFFIMEEALSFFHRHLKKDPYELNEKF